METRSKPAVGRAVVGGAIAGLIASVLMAMFAMTAAATYQDTGFFTPCTTSLRRSSAATR